MDDVKFEIALLKKEIAGLGKEVFQLRRQCNERFRAAGLAPILDEQTMAINARSPLGGNAA